MTKEAADLLLMDDNFASIVKGVGEGRLVFDNLKKSIAYALTAKVCSALPHSLSVFINSNPCGASQLASSQCGLCAG